MAAFRLDLLHAPEASLEPYTARELAAMAAWTCPNRFVAARTKAAMWLMRWTGLRRSEIWGLPGRGP